MNWKGMLRAALIVALGLVLSACGGAAVRQGPSKPQTQQQVQRSVAPVATGPMRVAILAPLTGDFAPIGQQLVNATAIALFEDQQTPVELLPFDTRGTPEGAAEAANSALRQRADMVIGPLFGKHVPVVRQTLAGSNVAILTFTNDTTMAGGNVFVLGISVADQMHRMMGQLARDGRNRVLLLGPDTAYTEHVLAALQSPNISGPVQLVRAATFDSAADFNSIAEQVKKLTDYDRRRANWRSYESRLVPQVRAAADPAGLLQGEAAKFAPDSVSYRMLQGMASIYRQHISRGRNAALSEVISRIEGVDASPADDFDVVMLPFADENLIAVGSMLDLYNAGHPFARVVGTNLWQNEDLARGPSFHQAWYTAADQTAQQPFLQTYRSTYQAVPDPIAVLGYYAARVAMSAASANIRPVTPIFVRRPNGFSGQAGAVLFGADNLMRHPLTIYEVTPEGPREVDGQAGPSS